MDLQYSEPIVHKPKAKHTATILILHGLGDTGHGWSDLALEYRQQLPHVKWIFPNAPTRKITVNMGLKMPGWYDIVSFDKINGMEDEQGIKESSRYIQSLIAEEVKAGIPAKRVLVCGFSQGGVMALMALREPVEVGGILGLSSYLPLHMAPTIVAPENKDTKVLMCHGTADPVVKYEYGQISVEKLKAAGAKVDFKSYPGIGHSVCPEEMFEVAAFWMTCVGTA
ncbi:hypothetical protein WJX73_002185 [Symbiochloris irregularis]|uniref:Phospholipase/carboxylesterase/thioesterase domain-containing protein n=1 Tax=Symbiochloris irregularis TaxID=706552 RepID=A0AAW1PBW7_9CHLO